MTNQEKLGGVGASEISKLFTKAGVKAKTAQTLAFDKAVELIRGYKKDITTKQMLHGIFNEEEAFHNVVKVFYPNSRLRSDESIPIAKDIWCTPDVTDDVESATIDIKCPYTPFTYWQNIKNLKPAYVSQIQMQLMGTGHKQGFVCLYLTSNRIDDHGNKIEYEIPIERRHFFIPVPPSPEYQQEILTRVDAFFPIRDKILDHLEAAPVLSDLEFFAECAEKKVTRFKDKSNLLTWKGFIFRNDLEYYVIEKYK